MIRSLIRVQCIEHDSPLRKIDRRVFEEVEQEDLVDANQRCHLVVFAFAYIIELETFALVESPGSGFDQQQIVA